MSLNIVFTLRPNLQICTLAIPYRTDPFLMPHTPIPPLFVDDIIVSGEVLREVFTCDIAACKGACCVEGSGGAPLEAAEMTKLEEIYEVVAPYLPEEGRDIIAEKGLYTEESPGYFATSIADDAGACAFTVFSENGTAQCGIELSWRDGKHDFRKPISCHLYPIRIHKSDSLEAVNYDRWNICSPACALGEKTGIRVFEFAKDAIIRKYGEGFYGVLEAAAKRLEENK